MKRLIYVGIGLLLLVLARNVYFWQINRSLSGAAMRGNAKRVEQLLRWGANPNSNATQQGNAISPLLTAVVVQRISDPPDRAAQDLEVARVLLEHGATPNLGINFGPLLALPVTRNDTALVRLFLQHGADVNRRDAFGQTPLLLSAGNTEMTRLLL